MLKKSILTPVLSGVLAATVVGSGAYYFVSQKNVDKDESSSQSEKADADIKDVVEKTTDKVSEKVDDVKDSVTDQVDTIEKAMTGDLDFSYNASFTFTPGEALKNQSADVDIKSVALNASAKQKGDAAQFTLSGAYDGKTLATANIIGDRTGDMLYAQVPELSSAYVSVKGEQLKSMMQQAIEAPLKTYTEKAAEAAQAQGVDANADVNAQLDDFKGLLEALDTIDQDALAKDIEEYLQTAADNFPEGKDKENTKGTVDGVSYELTTKSYTVTQDDAKKIAKALLEKAKDDTIIKDFLDNDSVSKVIDGAGSEEYVQGIEGFIAEIDKAAPESDNDDALEFDVMFDADGAFAGFNINIEGGSMYEVITAVDDALVVDVKFDSGNGDFAMTMAGAIKNENDTLNGSVKVDATSQTLDANDNEKTETVNMVYSLKDVKVTDDAMTGTISFDATAGDQTVGMVFTSNSTADKTDLVYSASVNGQNMFDMGFVLEKTDASDITIPTDAIAIDLQTGAGADTYAATFDLDGFQKNLKDALGDELYNAMFQAKDYAVNDSQMSVAKIPTKTNE